MKQCTKCKVEKVEIHENFPRCKSFNSGFNSMCRSCIKEKQIEYRQRPENKKKHREKMAQWRKENPEEAKEVNKKSRDKHKDRINKARRERYNNDPEFRAKKIESDRKYNESGKRRLQRTKPDQMEKSRLRNKKRRSNPILKAHDYKRNYNWRIENKERLIKLDKKYREEMTPSYIAQTLNISVKDITPDILDTKRLIISLKRELKSKNVKIR